jgi:hypothetical protein
LVQGPTYGCKYWHFQTKSCSLEDGHSQVAFNADGDLLKPTKVTLGLLYVCLLRID